MLIDTEALRLNLTTRLFEGARNGGGGLSIFLVDYTPGTGPRLHVHPHPEVFVIESGETTFTVGARTSRLKRDRLWWRQPTSPHRFMS
jgi:quercetin dioxygenase-like cupin family protein